MQIRNNFLCYLFSPSGEYEAESVSHATPLYRRRSPQPPSTHRFEIKIQKKIIKIMSGHNVLTVTISVIAGVIVVFIVFVFAIVFLVCVYLPSVHLPPPILYHLAVKIRSHYKFIISRKFDSFKY